MSWQLRPGLNFDTSTHALRLIVKSVLEKHPFAKAILGHMSENIPFYLWRLDSCYVRARFRNTIGATPSECFVGTFGSQPLGFVIGRYCSVRSMPSVPIG